MHISCSRPYWAMKLTHFIHNMPKLSQSTRTTRLLKQCWDTLAMFCSTISLGYVYTTEKCMVKGHALKEIHDKLQYPETSQVTGPISISINIQWTAHREKYIINQSHCGK